MSRQWYEDYFTKRLGTPGGIQARQDWDDHWKSVWPQTKPQPRPRPAPTNPTQTAAVEQRAAARRQAGTIDVVISLLVFIAATIAMRHSMGLGGALAVSAIPAFISLRFWRQLLALGVVVGVIYAIAHSK
ncbi:MAG TPA: hypothetical protein VFA89_19250 [Terriglobales bacterium]|nr:hypothetical protein [Terriglobales bacterium]